MVSNVIEHLGFEDLALLSTAFQLCNNSLDWENWDWDRFCTVLCTSIMTIMA